MKKYLISFFRGLMLFMLSLILHVDTVSAKTAKPRVQRLSGHYPEKAVGNAVFVDHVEADTNIPVTFILPLRNQSELESLVQGMYDPNDTEHYGKYLTSDEFIERYAPSQADYKKVVAYARGLGFTVTNTHPNRLLVNAVAPTAAIETAFDLRMQYYQHANGRKFYAPSTNPQVPAQIASVISGVVGLDNHAVWRAHHRRKKASATHHAAQAESVKYPSGPAGGFSPGDLITAYNLEGVSANGTGQVIALFELAGYQASDIAEYTKYFGLPVAQLKNILVDGGSKIGPNAEVTLDIELGIALAPKSQIYVYEGPNSDQGVLDTYNRIATDNIAKQVSTSWGLGESLVSNHYLQAENAIFLQMAAHGQTIYAAAGDSGAYDNYDNNPSKVLEVDDPASQQYVVAVGGTRLSVDPATGAYRNESIWNNGLGDGAGGGGVSRIWPIPSWQAHVPTVYSTANRNVPDVALNADPDTGYSIYFDGQWQIYGGTSCAAPLWAAFTACVNQKRASQQMPALGFANPALYAIASAPQNGTNFHDVTTGDNLFYEAQVGYDNASGWGSFDGANMFASLASVSPTPSPVTPILNIAMGNSSNFRHGVIGTYKIEVSNIGTTSSSGPVAVAVALPAGLRYRSFSGSGWSFNSATMTFTQDTVVQPGESYPELKLNVTVSANARQTLTATATVSGGGAASSTAADTITVK